ncbi:MAG TPA: enoyl-CoA hydratase/isomerase family protein [Chloroflexota bacterium]|nr:enoyl-CoA hydratase/isomerase family protein [Chloroflexota bacterium]
MREPASVLYEVRDGVATLTLNRPRVLNALDTTLVSELADAAERASGDDGVWLTVLRGAGRAFCSGIDRAALSRGQIDDRFYREIARATNALEDMPKLSIAVLHGWSIGGGLQVASACDLRLASTDAVLEFGATRHGLMPDATVLRIARLIGLGHAKELALLNDRVSVEQALTWGLVNWLAPPEQLEAKLAQIVGRAGYASRTAVAATKRMLQASFHRDPRSMVDELIALQRECHASWELQLANEAWSRKEDVRFFPRS